MEERRRGTLGARALAGVWGTDDEGGDHGRHEGAEISPYSVIADNVVIAAGATVERSVIAEGAVLVGALVGRHSYVQGKSRIRVNVRDLGAAHASVVLHDVLAGKSVAGVCRSGPGTTRTTSRSSSSPRARPL